MKNVKIVIGANWGDEGKGLMTDYFCAQAKINNESCLVVCHNGGAQKGHTVKTIDGKRHIFHHFGAGAFQNAATYLASTFIINPYLYNKEREELKNLNANIQTFVHEECLLTTPYDIFINQLIEKQRDKNRHGSCGVGIFETIKRNNISPLNIRKFMNSGYETRISLLKEIKDYYIPYRLKELGILSLSDKDKELLQNENIIINFIDDFEKMMQNITITDNNILISFDNIVFEGAQGLALDQNNIKYMPHLTPSNTGSINPVSILNTLNMNNINIEVCYVTRTYFTRHGAGTFPTECKKEDINPDIIDLTNVPNPYQESIRYGYFDKGQLMERINNDLINFKDYSITKSIALTHLNYTENNIVTKNGREYFITPLEFNIYLSDNETYKGIKKQVL